MVRRFGEDEDLDVLWAKYVGSSFLNPVIELKALRKLYHNKILSDRLIYKLYMRTKIWRAKRMRVLERDGFQCVMCKSKYDLHVDHLKYSIIGSEKMENLQTLCFECHKSKTKIYDLASQNKSQSQIITIKGTQLYELLRRK